jgi:cell division protease FtsH
VALLEKETLDKAEIAAVFEPLRRRSARPAWTGSPTREPSSIPPVDVPKSASNGVHPDGSQGAVILTPPGGGGDVHGDPGLRSTDS